MSRILGYCVVADQITISNLLLVFLIFFFHCARACNAKNSANCLNWPIDEVIVKSVLKSVPGPTEYFVAASQCTDNCYPVTD